MTRFEMAPTPLDGLTLLQRLPITDARGFFERVFCTEDYANLGLAQRVTQINHTKTLRRGAARGLHFQLAPHAEAKLVSCMRGEVFDVAVDIRAGSPTFLQWHGQILSESNHCSLYIPPGFAHGFQCLTDDCQLLYLHSEAFAAGSEGAINLLDPRLAIAWPDPIVERSDRDAAHPMLDDTFEGLRIE